MPRVELRPRWCLAASSLILAACGDALEAPPQPLALRVMTFNVEYGGTGVDFEKVVEAAAIAEADVIGLEEPYGNAGLIAAALGWGYVSRRTDVISKFPLIDPPGADGRYVWVELAPGRIVAIANVHLPSDPYGPSFTWRCPEPSVLQLEREVRLPAIQPLLDVLSPLAEQGLPVFIVGDFNAPTHLDWTPETVGERPQLVYPLRWPVSVAMEQAGFTDSYRAVHPDARAEPGLTWFAARPNIEDDFPATDPQDRIDLVYAAGPARPQTSQIVGEPGARDVELSVAPWPSDHRAVVSSFVVQPMQVPVFVSVEERRVEVGARLRARFHAPGHEDERVALLASGQTLGEPPSVWVSTGVSAPLDGVVELPTAGLSAGAHEVVLLSSSDEVLSRAPFWLVPPGAPPEVELGAAVYASGEPLVVSWRNAPGNRWDWVGVYRAPADPLVDDYLVWGYLNTRIDGQLTLDRAAQGSEDWPLEPGSYEALLLLYDAYDVAARASFEVSPGVAPEPVPDPAALPAWDAACSEVPVAP